jgi:hypothetical protein
VAISRPAPAIGNTASLASSNFPALAAPAPSSISGLRAITKSNNDFKPAATTRAVDLSATNFPALATTAKPSASAPRYAAAQTLAKKLQSSSSSASNPYPSLTAHQRKPPAAGPPQIKSAPNTDSPASFPALPATADASTLGNMKIILGTTIFKALKSYTKQYSQGELSAQAYIDYAASVFEGGYSDPNFWKFVPALVESCPTVNPAAANGYLQELRKLRNGAINAEVWNRNLSQKQGNAQSKPNANKNKGKQAKELQSMAFSR